MEGQNYTDDDFSHSSCYKRCGSPTGKDQFDNPVCPSATCRYTNCTNEIKHVEDGITKSCGCYGFNALYMCEQHQEYNKTIHFYTTHGCQDKI